MSNKPKYTTYEIPGIYGKTDLTSLSPWFSSSYGWAPVWKQAFDDVTEESYKKDPEAYLLRVVRKNIEYIEQLKLEGKYLKPFVHKITLRHNLLFDTPAQTQKQPLESYRMVFLDADAPPTSGAGIMQQLQNQEPYKPMTMEMFEKAVTVGQLFAPLKPEDKKLYKPNNKTMTEQQENALHFETIKRFPNHQVVMGKHVDPITTKTKWAVELTPKKTQGSGVINQLTDEEVPIGKVRLQSESEEDFINKLKFTANLLAPIEENQHLNTDFGFAIAALKAGKCVARKGWNGKGMFIFMRPGDKLPSHVIANVQSLPQSVKDQYRGTVPDVVFTSYLCMKAADGTIVNGWLASQTDMLAEDWEIIKHN